MISGSALLYELDMPVAGRRPAGARARRRVSRHPADDPRASSALHLRALRRALRGVGRLLRHRVGALQDAVLPDRPIRWRSASCARCAWSAACRGRCARRNRWPVERPGEGVAHRSAITRPGQIQSGTGFRGQGGRQDYTVYSQIRFPLAEAPAFAGTELFHRGRARASPIRPRSSRPIVDGIRGATISANAAASPVGQCPAGIGHQGQDIRPLICRPAPNSDRCDPPGDVVAARDGVILRSPRQEAAYLFVNSANEHIRFRYLHMNPRKMDADKLLSGRRVDEGEVIGEVGNYSMREAGTSYHLHFDIQVPTRTAGCSSIPT